MNCSRVTEFLALSAGGDLTHSESVEIRMHLKQCRDCRELGERLLSNLTGMQSLRHDRVPPEALAQMHKGLMARIESGEARLGWWLRLERFLVMQLRRPRYAVAGVALAVVISATLVTQLRQVAANLDTMTAVLDDEDALNLPENYREWVFLGTSATVSHTVGSQLSQTVYINPSAFREYRRSGHFPDGTAIVLESTTESGTVIEISASLKDRRFTEGWGYFRFENNGYEIPEKAAVLPVADGCVTCHRDQGATDHVFTQFYPVLRGTSGVL